MKLGDKPIASETKLIVVVVAILLGFVGWSKWNDLVDAQRSGLANFRPMVCEKPEGDCRRGYDWAFDRELMNGNDCPTGVSEGFYQGCLSKVAQTLSDLAPDDTERMD
jgi:hypothetical protein